MAKRAKVAKPVRAWDGHEFVTVNGEDYLRIRYTNAMGMRATQWRKLGPVLDDFETHHPVRKGATRGK